jgi:hypothetical protein
LYKIKADRRAHMEEELKIIITELVNAVTDEDLLDLVYRLLLASVQSLQGSGM